MIIVSKFQIGKSGVTKGVIESLALSFKRHRVVRISVLKNSVRDKAKVKEMAEEIKNSLEGDYNYNIIGFTIVMKKLGKFIKVK